MSGSGFATAADDLGALHERIADATAQITNFDFPGEGKVERAFNSVQASLTADATAAGQYAEDAATACGTQAEIDHGLELAPTPADLNALLRQATESGDPEAKAAFDAAVEDYKQARTAHENSTLGNCFPTASVGTCGVPIEMSGEGGGSSSEGEDDGDLSGLDGEGNEDEDTPVSMSEDGGRAPVTMSTGGEPEAPVQMSDGLPPTPLSDSAVGTETSGSLTPTNGAGTGTLSQPTQATPGGTPMQGTHTTPNAAFGATGGRSPQLGQPSAGARTPAPKPRKDDDTTSASSVTGVAGVTGAAAPSSPASTPSGTGAGTPPPTAPPPATGAPTAPGQSGTGQGGVGGGGLAGAGARPPQQPLGSGDTVTGQSDKPIYRYEPELLPGDDGYNWLNYEEPDDDPLLTDDDTNGTRGAA